MLGPLVLAASLFTRNVPAGTFAEMPVTFVLGGTKSRDVGDDAGAEIDVALRTWSQVACTSFRGRYGGSSAIASGQDDGVNVVLFHDDAWPATLEAHALAQTVVTLDASGNVHDADIHVNSAEYRFSLDGRTGTIDLRSVLVHEIGHALGLGHSDDPRATMHATGSGLRWRSLEADDVDGVCTLYPRGDAMPAPRCDLVPCPSGLVCVAGVCQRRGANADVCSPCERVPGACEAAGDDARCIDLAGGRVCARACTTDVQCGAGFRCLPTTASGDLQCVSDDACTTSANACTTSDACASGSCIAGSCKGPGDAPDAGADASPPGDASVDAAEAPAPESSDGCGCRTSDASSTRVGGDGALAAAAALVAWCVSRRTKRRRASR